MDKKDFIAKKMKILMGEGKYNKAQAFAIANSYAEKEYAQQGVQAFLETGIPYDPNYVMPTTFKQNIQNPQFSLPSLPSTEPKGNYIDINDNEPMVSDMSVFTSPEQRQRMYENKVVNTTFNNYDENGNAIDTNLQQPIYNTRYNIANPYGGYSPELMAMKSGQLFGSGNAVLGTLAGAGSLLGFGRNFMTGFATSKENNRVRNEYFDNAFSEKPNYSYYQQGGENKITNADFLTGQYATDEGRGNVNVEGGEYLNRQGNVQEVVGEPHIKNGKKADGVDVNLQNGDKVLSNYTKIPAKNVKELKERYNLSLKKGATFADAQKAFDKKLGIKKVTEELSDYIEQFGKNEAVKDETTKRLNASVLAKEIEEYKGKLEELKQPQSMFFDNLFSIQESLPKIGGGKQLLDKNGKPLEEESEDVAQQGGQQDQMQQLYQAVAQMLQQGVSPEQIAQELVNQGVPQEVVGQIIQEVANQLQGQSPQEEQMEGQMSNEQEEADEEVMMAQQGIRVASKFENPSLFTKQDPTTEEWQTFGELLKSNPNEVLNEIKRVHPELYNKYFKDNKVPSYDKIRNFQEDVNKKYEDIRQDYIKVYGENSKQVKELDTYIEADKFLPENRQYDEKQDRIVNKEVRGIDSFLGNWTSTRPNFAINVLPKEELEKVRKEGVNTAWELRQKFPEIYNKYVGDKKLTSDFWLEEIPEITPTKTDTTNDNDFEKKPQIPIDRVQTVTPWLPQALRLPPSSLDPLAKEQVSLPRLEPIKLTTEPMLAEQERQRQTDVSRIQSSGLTSQQQEALLASGLSASQIASNDAIAKVEMANQQNQYQVDQFNAGQIAKEDITNAQFRQDYQNKVLGSLNAYERDLRNFYTEDYLDRTQKFKDIENLNLLNAKNDQYQYVPGQNVIFLGNRSVDHSTPKLNKAIEDLTAEEQNIFKEEFTKTGDYNKAFIKAKQKYGM